MKKKFIYFLFLLCLIKLYDIADRSLKFSPNLLINSFQENAGEKDSLNFLADDFIPIRNFFVSKNILKFKLSNGIIKNEDKLSYLNIIEFNYPIRMEQSSPILVTYTTEYVQTGCKLIYSTKNYNIHECE